MDSSFIWVIVAMGAVTYLSRVTPFLLFRGRGLPIFWRGVLRNIPFAALGALIFPGVLTDQPDLRAGAAGAAAAFLLARLGTHIVIVIIGAIAVAAIINVLL